MGDQYPHALKSNDPDYSATAIFSCYPVEIERHDEDIIILGCDCNAPETSETRAMLEAVLANSAKVTGWVLPQPNLPAVGPFYAPRRNDYIFHRGEIEPISIYTIYDSAGSDHRPILGQFRVND